MRLQLCAIYTIVVFIAATSTSHAQFENLSLFEESAIGIEANGGIGWSAIPRDDGGRVPFNYLYSVYYEMKIFSLREGRMRIGATFGRYGISRWVDESFTPAPEGAFNEYEYFNYIGYSLGLTQPLTWPSQNFWRFTNVRYGIIQSIDRYTDTQPSREFTDRTISTVALDFGFQYRIQLSKSFHFSPYLSASLGGHLTHYNSDHGGVYGGLNFGIDMAMRF